MNESSTLASQFLRYNYFITLSNPPSRKLLHMPSSFAWLDYSEAERDRMQEALAKFREQDTRDEIGIGVIRDALADWLFPGTSTIQTRVRYFLFAAWMYRQLEAKPPTSRDVIEKEVRDWQFRLRNALAQADNNDGIIGKIAGFHVQRLPDSVYWQGMIRWGILRRSIAREVYWRSLTRRSINTEEIDPVYTESIWSDVPPMPVGMPQNATFALSYDEAEYLRKQIATYTAHTGIGDNPSSVFSYLARHPELYTSIKDTRFAWDIPVDDTRLIRELDHARRFSIVIQGARLLYNLMLAERRNDASLIASYQNQLEEWYGHYPRQLVSEWDIPEFFALVRRSRPNVAQPAFDFVRRWFDFVLNEQALSDAARKLIYQRERTIKGSANARLESQRALELWSGQSGGGQLDFRWGNAKSFLSDIHGVIADARTE